MQEAIAYLRNCQIRAPCRRTPSTSNYVVERFWPEINARVNYPIKRAINILIEQNEFDLEDDTFKYCISRVTLYVSQDAVRHFISSWNHHRIPGSRGCIPIECMISTSRTSHPPPNLIPTYIDAVDMYENNGGALTRVSEFGTDPLSQNEFLFNLREHLFHTFVSSPNDIFANIVHGDTHLLKDCLIRFYDITLQLSNYA